VNIDPDPLCNIFSGSNGQTIIFMEFTSAYCSAAEKRWKILEESTSSYAENEVTFITGRKIFSSSYQIPDTWSPGRKFCFNFCIIFREHGRIRSEIMQKLKQVHGRCNGSVRWGQLEFHKKRKRGIYLQVWVTMPSFFSFDRRGGRTIPGAP
jgi:hypothetical protein